MDNIWKSKQSLFYWYNNAKNIKYFLSKTKTVLKKKVCTFEWNAGKKCSNVNGKSGHKDEWNPTFSSVKSTGHEWTNACMYERMVYGVAYFSQLCGHIMLKVLSSFGTRVLIPVLKATHELLQHRTCARHPGSSGAASRGPCNVCSRFYSLPK